MKIPLCCAMLLLFLFSGLCLAQGPSAPVFADSAAAPVTGGSAPVPVLVGSASDELSADFMGTAKGPRPWSFGEGGQIGFAHFLNKYLGVKLQSAYEKMSYCNQTEAGVRVGPILRFATFHRVQPYLEGLVGYARVQATYLRPASEYHGSGSVLGGGGFDFRLPGSGRWYARAGVEVQDDWSAHTSVGHGFVGISYRFDKSGRPQ